MIAPRRLLIAAAAGCLLATAPVPEAAAQSTVRFTYATANGPRDFGSQAAQRWARAMREASNGELQMNVVTGGSLGGDRQLLQQLSTNEIQIHSGGPVVLHHLAQSYLCLDAEFVFDNNEHGLRVWNGAVGNEIRGVLERDHRVTILGVAARGARHVSSNRPIRSVEDFRGLKIRVTNPLRAEIFTALGALPGTLAIDELYGALRAGVFDAQENPISTIFGNRYYEVQSAIALTGHVWSYNVFSASKPFLDGLSPQHREILTRTLQENLEWLNRQVAEEEDDTLKRIQQLRRVEVTRPDLEAIRSVALPIVERFAQQRCRPGLLADIRAAAPGGR